MAVEQLSEGAMEEKVHFGVAGILEGIRLAVPIGFSTFAYGLVMGVLTAQARLTLWQAMLMSGMVFAGASQFTAIGIWLAPLPVATIIITTLVVNLRHLLMGAAIYNWLKQLTFPQRYLSLFFLTDENWALTVGHFDRGKRNGAFLLGSGLVLWVAWVSSTIVGHELGSILPEPEKLGLDFAFVAVFLALLSGMWKGISKSLRPWLVAAVVAVVAGWLIPGKWYILLGGLAGSLVGAWQENYDKR